MPVLEIGGKAVEVETLDVFDFPEPGPTMFYLTCKNHPTSLYLTKNPFSRSLHMIRSDREVVRSALRSMGKRPTEKQVDVIRQVAMDECDCEFWDLVVLRDGDPEKG